MNWWQNNNPYGPPPGWGGPPGYIPVPPGTDPIKIMEFMDRVQRRAAKAKDPKKEEKKEEKKHWHNALWYFQAACVVYFISPPIAALQHIVSTVVASMIK